MTNLKNQQDNPTGRRKNNVDLPSNINTNNNDQQQWSHLEALNQMTPVQILTDSDLQQELEFYASTQFRYDDNITTAPSTPLTTATNNRSSSSYFEQRQQTFHQPGSTPQLNIPVDANDYATSNNMINNNDTHFPSSTTNQQYNNNKNMNQHNLTNLSMLFDEQQQQQAQQNQDAEGLILSHEPGIFARTIAASAPQRNTPSILNGNNGHHANNNMYSNHNTPINSTPTSPTVGVYDNSIHHQGFYDSNDQQPNSTTTDRFATMFLSSSSSSNNNNTKINDLLGEKSTKRNSNAGQKNQQFRFKKDTNKQQHPLDYLLLSKHNMEQELQAAAATAASGGESSTIKPAPKRKNSKQKESTTTTTTAKGKRRASIKKKEEEIDEEDEDRMILSDDNNNNNNNEEDEDEPVIGDGAQSYSSMGSSSSRTSLTKDDKRRRNTAASARFRIKKKMREQALQNTACEMTDKAKRMEQRVHELEREIKWLKALVVEKNEARLEQLVRERPPNSTAFPSSPSPSLAAAAAAANLYQNGNSNNHHSSSNNDDYEEDDDEEYSNQY